MKTILSILFSVLLFSSCMKDEMEFSCDPMLNDYILTHKFEFVQYTAIDLAASEPLVQQAIFRSFEPAKKREIWLQKIQFLLDNEPYSEAEYIHVKKLLEHVHENYFSKENLELEIGQRSQFANDWIKYAKSNLGWSGRYVAFIVFRMYTNQKQFDTESSVIKTIQQKASASSEEAPCGCNASYDYCESSICNSGNCQISTGCGWMWSETCNGRCL